MNEPELQRVYKYHKYSKGSRLFSVRGLAEVDNGSEGGTHWTCFIIKENESYYFDSFGGGPDIFLLNQLPKPLFYHNYKIQDINLKICGLYCLYFF